MMSRIMQLLLRSILVFCLLILIACSRVNQKNYDKIQPGMAMQDVVKILGEPTSTDSINIAGISGAAATWKNKDAVISIQFLNNQVTIKSFNKDGNTNGQPNGF